MSTRVWHFEDSEAASVFLTKIYPDKSEELIHRYKRYSTLTTLLI